VHMGRTTGRPQADDSEDAADSHLGPGTYDVDDCVVAARAPSAFFGTSASRAGDGECKGDAEGDVLVLDMARADAATRAGVRGAVEMDKQLGRREPKAEHMPEALDYTPDESRVRARLRGFSMDGQMGREDGQEEEDEVYGKYTPKYTLCEASVTGVVPFDKMSGRHDAEAHMDSDGDVLVLDTHNADEYLRRKTGTPLLDKQLPRPDTLPGQRATECTATYDPDLSAITAHVPVVDFGKLTSRTDGQTDDDADKLGPGTYDPSDELLHPRPPAAVMMPLVERVGGDDSDVCEGDVLDLHPERADALTRPTPPRTILQV
jgi:hypothetical protein